MNRIPRVTAPPSFRVDRARSNGSHALLAVFPGLDRLPGFRSLPTSSARRRSIARSTRVQIVPGRLFMYVAPHTVPELLRRGGFVPFTSPGDCIVVGHGHLRRGARMVLYMDILHELCHVIQRATGRELWQEGYRYADRPTEIEAYRFVIALARERGATDAFLREYLRVGWMTPKEHRLLLRNVGVASR